jgi:hypothetical protein
MTVPMKKIVHRTMWQRLQFPMIIVLVVLLVSSETRQRVIVYTQTCNMQTIAKGGATETNSQITSGESKGVDKQQQVSDTIDEEYAGPQTTWKLWPEENPFPCFQGEVRMKTVKVQKSPADTGLLFVREMKTASSTVAGVLLRLAHRRGATTLPEGGPCRLRVDHSSAIHQKYGERDRDRSYLISLLREPTKRAISHFFHFYVSEKKTDPTDAHFEAFFSEFEATYSNYYIKDLATGPVDLSRVSLQKSVKEVLKQYDFIAITERMDESLVVFKMLLGLELDDILYMSAKSSGSFTTGPTARPCIYLTPAFISKGMKAFFDSKYWERYTRADQLLYKAAVKSLDNTIDSLGRDKVKEEVAVFRKAQAYAHAKCDERTVYRCNSRGEFIGRNATCYMWDIGCGYQCLNEISIENGELVG